MTTQTPRLSAAFARFGMVVAAHPVLDAYAGFVPPLIGVLQVRCDLSTWQAASLLSLGPLISGICQPFFAWLSDRIDSRIFGTAGLAVAAAALSSIGLADSFATLVVLFCLGMLGVGAFHPVAAASVGQLAGRRRSAGVTVFFVAGMIGATAGPIISTRLTAVEPNGFDLLRWVMIPGLVVAGVLHIAIRRVSHHQGRHIVLTLTPEETRQRWGAVLVLFLGNCLRFFVNIALLYLFVRWAEAYVAGEHHDLNLKQIATLGSIYCGELNALMMLGMGLGGLLLGVSIRPGWERTAFIVLPLVLAPVIAVFPFAGRGASYVLAVASGVGFASVIPLAISLAQHLLPHRTSLASGLMMGAAWTVASLAPAAAEWSLGVLGMQRTFAAVGAALALSGVVGLFLPGPLLRRVSAGTAVSP